MSCRQCRTDRQDQVSVNFELNCQPAPLLNAYAFYSYQYSRLKRANITYLMIPGGSPNAGGNDYPIANAWSVQSKDRDDILGFGVQYEFTKFRISALRATSS
jgi:hypothetical protein